MDHADPVLAVAEETGVPLAMHFGTSTQMPYVSPGTPFIAVIPLMGVNSMNALSEILFSPMLHKFPRLKLFLAEGGIGCIPGLLSRVRAVRPALSHDRRPVGRSDGVAERLSGGCSTRRRVRRRRGRGT
jgi:predicted TIM-barrel fold metal-dependent hydrolase